MYMEGLRKDIRIFQDSQPQLRTEPLTSWIRNRSANHSTMTFGVSCVKIIWGPVHVQDVSCQKTLGYKGPPYVTN
jgi:hypothetical protein